MQRLRNRSPPRSGNATPLRTRPRRRKLLQLLAQFVRGPKTYVWQLTADTGATRFKPGDAVYVRASRDSIGTFAEQIGIDEKLVAPKPATLSHVEAASLPLVGLTTLQGFGRAGARAGQRILIHAGSGGVGTFAVQYAKYLGLDVTSTTSSKNADFVKSLGP